MKLGSRLIPLGTVVFLLATCGYLVAVSNVAPPLMVASAQSAGGVPAASGTSSSSITIAGFETNNGEGDPRESGKTAKEDAIIKVNVTSAVNGRIALFRDADRVSLSPDPIPQARNMTVTLALQEGVNRGRVEWIPVDNSTLASDSYVVTLDTTGPQFKGAILEDAADGGSTLRLQFAEGDFKSDSLKNHNFPIYREAIEGGFTGAGADQITATSDPVAEGNVILISLPKLAAGRYRVTVKGETVKREDVSPNEDASPSNDNTKPLQDKLGNHAGGTLQNGRDRYGIFHALGDDRPHGQHVEFPSHTPPKQYDVPEEGFNPADYVDTRVARLYYYRDAHRVAEIINRNVRSYNRAAVNLAERRAEQARDEADRLTDERRHFEREAVRAAQMTRNAEANLEATRRMVNEARNLQAQVDDAEQPIKNQAIEAGFSNAADANARRTEYNTAYTTMTEKRRTVEEKRRALEKAPRELEQAKSKKAAAEERLTTAKNDRKKANDKLDTIQDKIDKANDAGRPEAEIKQLEGEKEKPQEEYNEADGRITTENTNINMENTNIETAKERIENLPWEIKQAEAELDAATEKVNKMAAVLRMDAQNQQLTNRVAELTGTGGLSSLMDRAAELERTVAELRRQEIAKQEESQQAQAKEDRAREKQWREEVAAATTDPDTYVAGKIHSVDPVTQVSISVIGEGLIHLRGPIKGINKIRRMINQIDSPVGQIKIGIQTVQVNGEEGDRMERVVGDVEGYIDLGRFLTNQSLNLLRRAIQTEAAMAAAACETGGHYQVDRDRRYLYNFFGRDFIDELYAIDSEFLHTENKVLSLHSMDTVSLNRALFILALAKNDVRERILQRFTESIHTELADAEWDFRRSSELRPHKSQKWIPPWNRARLPVWNKRHMEAMTYEAVHRNAAQRYHFRNIRGFFDTGFVNPDTMNPMQREFIRLAQIFKSQMVAEIEWNQRILERGLIEDPANDEDEKRRLLKPIHDEALKALAAAQKKRLDALHEIQSSIDLVGRMLQTNISLKSTVTRWSYVAGQFSAKFYEPLEKVDFDLNRIENLDEYNRLLTDKLAPLVEEVYHTLEKQRKSKWLTPEQQDALSREYEYVTGFRNMIKKGETEKLFTVELMGLEECVVSVKKIWEAQLELGQDLQAKLLEFGRMLTDPKTTSLHTRNMFYEIKGTLILFESTEAGTEVVVQITSAYNAGEAFRNAEAMIGQAERLVKETRVPLNHRKLLNHLIDLKEDKLIELIEGTRSHIAAVDNYLKRLAIAIEDDLKVQFYDPAFVRIRVAARAEQVNLSQVERTTILTNNRAFAKVEPQATMEFDLPKRQIAIVEALNGARAMVQDYGALMNDPTFLAAFQMMGGTRQGSTVQNILPSLSNSTNQQTMGLAPPDRSGQPQSALQDLVPDPAIYKLETGTGFQLRPVIQPDGDSVIYDFDYMYTTNIREPVRADEKHLGRVKRHFVHTQVQTSSFEVREISRYMVALKVSRTSRGVPLLEDIPGLGAAFRPAPSAESSIQQNIILGSSTVYPTLFDLMGLRWAPYVADVNHTSLLDQRHVAGGRTQAIGDFIFDIASDKVDDILGIKQSDKYRNHYRPDLYHRHRAPSPYHPGGYYYPSGVKDPTSNDFKRADRRPPEMQEPPYGLYRHRPVPPERVEPGLAPPHIPPGHQVPPIPPPSGGTSLRVAPTPTVLDGAHYQPRPQAGRLYRVLPAGHNQYPTNTVASAFPPPYNGPTLGTGRRPNGPRTQEPWRTEQVRPWRASPRANPASGSQQGHRGRNVLQRLPSVSPRAAASATER